MKNFIFVQCDFTLFLGEITFQKQPSRGILEKKYAAILQKNTHAEVWNLSTVKRLYSGHHRDLKILSVTESCPLHRGSS